MIRCTKCGIEKDDLLFNKRHDTKNGRAPWCRECANAYSKMIHKKHYYKHKITQDKWRDLNPKGIILHHWKRKGIPMTLELYEETLNKLWTPFPPQKYTEGQLLRYSPKDGLRPLPLDRGEIVTVEKYLEISGWLKKLEGGAVIENFYYIKNSEEQIVSSYGNPRAIEEQSLDKHFSKFEPNPELLNRFKTIIEV